MQLFPTFINREDVFRILHNDFQKVIDVVEASFLKYENKQVLFPDKISQIFDQKTQNRINCMPATLLDDRVCGVKWISVFPTNAPKGLPNVLGVMLLSEIETGSTLAVVDAGYMTTVRTAAVGCLGAKYLAPSRVERVGFIGAGEEARMHMRMLKAIYPTIKECRVSSRKQTTEDAFVASLTDLTDVCFTKCGGDNRKSAENADIIVTAISGQAPVLKADYIKKGCLYIHVGGWEDEYAVPRKADKIVCDEWNACKHRSQTISRMFMDGELKDEDIYANMSDLITGRKAGRENDDEFIYFNSVGLSYIDVALCNYIYKSYMGENATLSKLNGGGYFFLTINHLRVAA